MSILLELKNIKKFYKSGDEEIYVLKNINLTINSGEMVAIIGASGSGKSTLMNILGCLDKASEGSYKIEGAEVASLEADELSKLRREYFGFIFQRYHLLNALTSIGNVEIPAIYAGVKANMRFERAKKLLSRLGLAERLFYKPNQLSGGQQQRVSIARALMNNGNIILADEPTGALDKQSGEEVLKILGQLHKEGSTLIIVTHDLQVAKKAQRIIEISDGLIIKDYLNSEYQLDAIAPVAKKESSSERNSWGSFISTFKEALTMALLSLKAHPMRSFLTMLGIIIGIGSVILMVALGNGTRQKIMANINSMGTNSLSIYTGKSMSDENADSITTLVDNDAVALAKLPYVIGASPGVNASGKISQGNISATANINGVGAQIFAIRNIELVQGRFFDEQDVKERNLSIVIDQNTKNTLFGQHASNVLGKTILIGQARGRVIGVLKKRSSGYEVRSLNIYIPYSTVQTRLTGNQQIQSISLRIANNISSNLAEQQITKILTQRHGTKDFFILNNEEFRKKIQQTMSSMSLLIVAIASISLLVGGIGVMNIMLVTVSERINEIGVRMAVGARQRDILQQFLIETIIICMIGGALGISLAFALGSLINVLDLPFKAIYSYNSIIMSLLFSSFIGVCFGFFPARNASKLNPVHALSRD